MMNPLISRWTIADVYEHTGINCYNLGDLEDAKIMLLSAVEHGESEDDDAEFMVSKFHNLAVVYFELNEYKKSDLFFHKALKCFVENPSMDAEKLTLLLNNYSLLMEQRNESVLSEAFSICAEFVSDHWFEAKKKIDFSLEDQNVAALMNVA